MNIKEALEEKINDLFIEAQQEAGIISGDLDPIDAIRLEAAANVLVEAMEKILARQAGNR